MRYSFLGSLLISSVLVIAACDDDNTTPRSEQSNSENNSNENQNNSNENQNNSNENQNNSNENQNNSNENQNNSNENQNNSNEGQETGLRAATLDDLQKNMELKLFDHTVYLSTGSKQGLFALRIPDELWVITYTDFANGELMFKEDNVGKQSADTDVAKTITGHLSEGIKLSFKIDEEGKILYAVNGSTDYSEAVKASVAVQKNKVSKAEELKDKIYTCTAEDQTQIFTFFDNSYIFESVTGEEVTFWQAGHYDVQRSTLLMRPAYFNNPADSMYTYAVGTDNTITSTQDGGDAMNCTVESSEYEYEKTSDFVGNWVASKDNIDWEFTLRADGTFELSAHQGENQVESKSGDWEIYGYHMMMHNKNCLHPESCTPGIHGQLQTGPIDPQTGKISGFSFIHSDSSTPAIPHSFDAPEYAGK